MNWINIIPPIVTALATVLTVILSNRSQAKLIEYKIQKLEEKVHKHNELIERTYKLEQKVENIEKNIDKINR